MKKILFLFGALMTMLPMFGQSDDGEIGIVTNVKSNALFLGPKIGGVMTTMGQPDEGTLYDTGGFGFSGGLAMNVRFGKATENSAGGTGFFGAGLELKYKQNNVKTIGTDEDGKENAKLSIGYFEIPVFIQLYPFVKSNSMNKFCIELGVAYAAVMSASPDYLTISAARYKTGNIKGSDIRGLIGLGYTLPSTGLGINARYYLGTSKLAGNLPCKMNSAEISIAWMFQLCKF